MRARYREMIPQEIKRELSLWSFSVFKDKSRIIRTYKEKKIWKEKIFVNEDLMEETGNIRKGLLKKAKNLRSQNKVVKVVHDRLSMKKREGMIFLKHKPNL